MARFDSADLLAQVKLVLGRPTTDLALSDATLYVLLSEAQDKWLRSIAVVAPEANYGAPVKLATADGGLTYTFGVDSDNAPLFPFGHVELRSSPAGRPMTPSTEWTDGGDFVFDGEKIRWPGGRAKTFPDGPYARFVAPAAVVSAAVQPTLKPKGARVLLIYEAAAIAAVRLKQDPAFYEARRDLHWFGDPDRGDHGLLGMLRTQYHLQGAMSVDSYDGRWWASIDDGSNY